MHPSKSAHVLFRLFHVCRVQKRSRPSQLTTCSAQAAVLTCSLRLSSVLVLVRQYLWAITLVLPDFKWALPVCHVMPRLPCGMRHQQASSFRNTAFLPPATPCIVSMLQHKTSCSESKRVSMGPVLSRYLPLWPQQTKHSEKFLSCLFFNS